MFNKILISNRGEIACRIIKTAKKMNIKTVAVYSDADRSAEHVSLADEAVYLGGSSASESYLRSDLIIKRCKENHVTRYILVMDSYQRMLISQNYCKKRVLLLLDHLNLQ